MNVPFYDLVVPTLDIGLRNLKNFLITTRTHCKENGISQSAFTEFRLYPDMLHFTKQVQICCNFALRGTHFICGKEPPILDYVQATIKELQASVEETRGKISLLTPEEFENNYQNPVVFNLRDGTPVQFPDGLTYIRGYLFPNFYFHLTTVYNIMRHNGVKVGKQDFIGVANEDVVAVS